MKKINLKIKWHKKGWATEGEDGELYSNPRIEILSSDEPNPTAEEQEKIDRAVRDYERSQSGGELITDNEIDSLQVTI